MAFIPEQALKTAKNQEAMMKNKLIVLSAVLVFVFSAALFANEKGEGPGTGMEKCMKGGPAMGGGPKMILAMASELNLTADQMDKIKKLIDTMPEKGAVKGEMKDEMMAVHEEMMKDSPDTAKIDKLIDDAAANHKAQIKEMIKNKAAVDAILTKEQKDILKKKMEEKKAKMQDKKEDGKKKQGK